MYLEKSGKLMMLKECCFKVFEEQVSQAYPSIRINLKADLLLAFEHGKEAAKQGVELYQCPYSAVEEPAKFLAWVTGYRCCPENL